MDGITHFLLEISMRLGIFIHYLFPPEFNSPILSERKNTMLSIPLKSTRLNSSTLVWIVSVFLLLSCSKKDRPAQTASQSLPQSLSSGQSIQDEENIFDADSSVVYWTMPAGVDTVHFQNFIATEDILPIYPEIPAKLPLRVNATMNPGIIYGETFRGKYVSKNRPWIELEKPMEFEKYWIENPVKMTLRYVPARGAEPAVEFKTFDGRLMVTQEKITVYLQPNIQSRAVLELSKGEVLQTCGTFENSDGIWYRSDFEDQSGDLHGGIGGPRAGWIHSSQVKIIKPDLDPSRVSMNEIPDHPRYANLAIISNNQKKTLTKNGFFIDRITNMGEVYLDDMVDLYMNDVKAHFITSDLFLHVYHLIFDRMLQNIETKKFLPALKEMTGNLYNTTEKYFQNASEPELKKALKRNLWYFGVAGRLLDSSFVLLPEIENEVCSELNSILGTNHPLPSIGNPNSESIDLPEFREDYTQYMPRGHYTLNNSLKKYFRVMMHYGRKMFSIRDNSTTLSALLITSTLHSSGQIETWNKMMTVIDYLIGKSDDWTPSEYAGLSDRIFGKNASPVELADTLKLAEFREKAKEVLKPQRIVSQQTRARMDQNNTQSERLEQTAGFKFMGQKYTLDAEIFQRLTAPSVGNDLNPKNLPSGLEIMTVLGSGSARKEIPQKWLASVPRYKGELEACKAQVDAYRDDEWNLTTYTHWLSCFKPLFASTKSLQLFMQSNAWGYKSLNTALGSWGELKHDTILYAEQSYAEQGSGPGVEWAAPYRPPLPKGYVEPNPDFFSRLASMNLKTISAVESAGFLTNEYKSKLTQFNELVHNAQKLAEKEIRNEKITDEDYNQILYFVIFGFNQQLLFPEDFMGQLQNTDKLEMALIADVATDAFGGQVLLEAVGYPQVIYVLVKDYWGGTRITQGYVYSYYEFSDEKRWTDEEWKKKVYPSSDGIRNLEPSWYKEFRAE